MKRRALALAVAATVVTAVGADEGPSILALMHKEFTTTTSPYVVVKKQLVAEAPDWDKIRPAAAKFLPLAEALAKREARHGGKDSWERLTGRHLDDVKAMDEAAQAGDLGAVEEAFRRVAASCKGCHDVHKFRRDR